MTKTKRRAHGVCEELIVCKALVVSQAQSIAVLSSQVGKYEMAIGALVAAVVGLFGWYMKAKADHYKDLRDGIDHARRAAGYQP